jgi:hypothetical protein
VARYTVLQRLATDGTLRDAHYGPAADDHRPMVKVTYDTRSMKVLAASYTQRDCGALAGQAVPQLLGKRFTELAR